MIFEVMLNLTNVEDGIQKAWGSQGGVEDSRQVSRIKRTKLFEMELKAAVVLVSLGIYNNHIMFASANTDLFSMALETHRRAN